MRASVHYHVVSSGHLPTLASDHRTLAGIMPGIDSLATGADASPNRESLCRIRAGHSRVRVERKLRFRVIGILAWRESIRARKEIIRSGRKTLRAWREVECVREEDVRAREMAERAIRQAQDGIAELEAQLEDPPAAPPAPERP